MAGNFPELWLNRVETNLTTADQAPWLEGVEELDSDVRVVGEGTETEKNVIHIATTDFEPDVLVNNTTYPLDAQVYADGTVDITLDKYQTKVITLSDDQAMGASYNKIDAATKSSTTAISKKKYGRAIHSIAPAGHTTATPVLVTTGDAIGGTGTRKRLVYADLVALKDAWDALEIPAEDRRLVLCTDHYNDLLLDRQNFGNLLINYSAGTTAPVIAGFQIFSYVANPYYTVATKVKKAYGTAASAGDFRASVAFYVPNIAKKTGKTKQYYKAASSDPDNQTNRLAYRHYFVAVPKRAKYLGAIVSGAAA
jgi:hypothetical protein